MAGAFAGAARAQLKVIEGGGGQSGRSMSFCGHCGAIADRRRLTAELPSVCEHCSVGVFLSADANAIPAGEPFIVVDRSLKVVVVSDRAEQLLGVYEPSALGRPVTSYLVDDHERPPTGAHFAVAISDALGADRIQLASARLRSRPDVTVRLRVTGCAPPRSALVVFAAISELGGPPLRFQASRGR